MTGSKELASVAAAAFLFISHPTTADQASLTIPQLNGPFDPEDQRRQPQRTQSELSSYIRTPEEHLHELLDSLPALVIVGGFFAAPFLIRRIRGY